MIWIGIYGLRIKLEINPTFTIIKKKAKNYTLNIWWMRRLYRIFFSSRYTNLRSIYRMESFAFLFTLQRSCFKRNVTFLPSSASILSHTHSGAPAYHITRFISFRYVLLVKSWLSLSVGCNFFSVFLFFDDTLWLCIWLHGFVLIG